MKIIISLIINILLIINTSSFYIEKEFGPYENIKNFTPTTDGNIYVTSDTSSGKIIKVNNNNIILGPYNSNGETILKRNFNENGYYIVTSKNEGFICREVYDVLQSAINKKDTYSKHCLDKINKYININGNIKGPYDNIKVIGDLSVGEKEPKSSGLIYTYTINNLHYLSKNNIEYGPYEEIRGVSYNMFGNGNIRFIYTKKNKMYFYNNGDIMGPYDLISGVKYSFKGWDGIYFNYTIDENIYIYANGKILGPSKSINIELSRRGINENYLYNIDNDYFIYNNGNTYGPYTYKPRYGINIEGDFYIIYDKDNSKYINYNGNIKGPYERISSIGFEDNNLKYVYINKSKYYIKYNGSELGPYDKIESKLGGFKYKKGVYEYINLNGKIYGPYNDIIGGTYDNIKGTTFIYKKNNLFNLVFKGNIYGPYVTYPHIYMSDNGENLLIIFKKGGLNYININGKINGPYDKDTHWHNNIYVNNNSFAYKYKLNGKEYININGTNYGPYNKVTYFNKNHISDGYIYMTDGQSYINTKNKNHGPFENYVAVMKDNSFFTTYKDKNNQFYLKGFYYVEPNLKIDRLLNKIFIKIAKSGELKAKKVYQGLLIKLDSLIEKATTDKNKELLEYIKYKVELKIK